MGANCSIRTTVIPDRESMVEIVDKIVEFEELLKKESELTNSQKKELRRVQAVAKEMKRLHTMPVRRTKLTQ